MFENYGETLSVTEICCALHLNRLKVYELLNSGKIKGWRPGKELGCGKNHVWRVMKEDLIDYVSTATGKDDETGKEADHGQEESG